MIRAFALSGAVLLVSAIAAEQSGVYSEAQAKNGQTIYHQVCAGCHQDNLEGGEHAPPLKGDAFWKEWDKQKARLLYRRIISTMPLDDPGSLPEKDVIDVVAYLLQVNGMPAGGKAIEKADDLNDITLDRPK
jgi:S-disulfanyl-L-cysteine oxidoreductase SoxD